MLRQSHIDCGMKFLLLPIANDTVNNNTLDVKKLYGQENDSVTKSRQILATYYGLYYIPYKMKYWRGVNFGDWRLLDEIANI